MSLAAHRYLRVQYRTTPQESRHHGALEHISADEIIGSHIWIEERRSRNMRGRIVIPAVLLVALCGVAVVAAAVAYYLWPRPPERPAVFIGSPSYGAEVAVGDTVPVEAFARDETGITRVELWVDGELMEARTGTLPGGEVTFPLLTSWQPQEPGPHTLIARAFNEDRARSQATVILQAVEIADGDADGVVDDDDLCPQEWGWASTSGCPDRDGDRTSDTEDACPDEGGPIEGEGCPQPSEGDRDGDGLQDEADVCAAEAGSLRVSGCPDADGDRVADSDDACPAEPGWSHRDGCPTPGDLDGDDILDGEDDCPQQPGLAEYFGCPDWDHDGIRDGDDRCPDEPGLPNLGGCPDRDGDGVTDDDDLRPDEPGLPINLGVPDTGAPDSDEDGVFDDDDFCIDELGRPEHRGCPPPGKGIDGDGDGIPDAEEPPHELLHSAYGLVYRFLAPDLALVEFQVLEFETGDYYDSVYCYVQLGDVDDPVERYGPFEVGEDRRHWTIPPELGSVNLLVRRRGRVRIMFRCGAYRDPLGMGWSAGLDTPVKPEHFDLGGFGGFIYPWRREHGMHRWSEEPLGRREEGLPWFRVTYAYCTAGCGVAYFQPPALELLCPARTTQYVLSWTWEGDWESITGFKVFMDGSYIDWVPSSFRVYDVRHLRPACGGTRTFHVTAFAGDPTPPNRESFPSNIVEWSDIPCERAVRVTFDTLETGDLNGESGPIEGSFRAGGEGIAFCGGCCYGSRLVCDGVSLESHRSYSIQGLLDEMRGLDPDDCAYCWSDIGFNDTFDSVLVLLEADEDLQIHGFITDMGSAEGSDTGREVLFMGSESIPADLVRSGPITISDELGHSDLTVEIEVLGAP
jgi:hypothetical protein